MDNSFLKEVQQRRKRDLAVLEGLNAKIKVMQMEADLVQQAVSAYDNILGNRSTNGGQRQQRVVTGGRKGSRKSGGLNKTTVLIEALLDSGDKGATPAEVFQTILDRGVKDFSKNYVYTVLHKLKGNGRLKEKGGKYFVPKGR